MGSIHHNPRGRRAWLATEPPRPSDACLLHPGKVDSKGYGFHREGGGRVAAHRRAYEEANGPIPPGVTVDHLCFTPLCINPRHLRLLPNEANARRQRSAMTDECRKGHQYTEENVYWNQGRRQCRRCQADAVRRYKKRKRGAA